MLISKHTENGKRTSRKEPIAQEQYDTLRESSILQLQKRRYEFTYVQADISFDVKLDEFTSSSLSILEVDADNEEDRTVFDPTNFPAELDEVTGTLDYYGYRVASVIL